jgi:ribonuclease VapC
VVDSSAIIAILENEPEARRFSERIAEATPARMSVVSIVETSMVMYGWRGGTRDVGDLLVTLKIELVDLDHAQALLALDAFARYGKGQHPARLNLGDLFSYALAKQLGEPLLFKGGDFAVTDIPRAL